MTRRTYRGTNVEVSFDGDLCIHATECVRGLPAVFDRERRPWVFADSLVPAALRPVPFKNLDGSEGVDLYLDRELFPETFAADVDPETAAVMAATQRPWSGAAAATPSGPPGWRSIPAWYLLGTEDRAIPPAGQRFMAERGNARIQEVTASHASMVAQPDAVTRLVLSAVEETSRSQP